MSFICIHLFSGGNRRYGGRGSDRQDRGEYNNYSRGGGRREDSYSNYNGMCSLYCSRFIIDFC